MVVLSAVFGFYGVILAQAAADVVSVILALVLPAGFWWFVLGGALIAAGIWLLRC